MVRTSSSMRSPALQWRHRYPCRVEVPSLHVDESRRPRSTARAPPGTTDSDLHEAEHEDHPVDDAILVARRFGWLHIARLLGQVGRTRSGWLVQPDASPQTHHVMVSPVRWCCIADYASVAFGSNGSGTTIETATTSTTASQDESGPCNRDQAQFLRQYNLRGPGLPRVTHEQLSSILRRGSRAPSCSGRPHEGG